MARPLQIYGRRFGMLTAIEELPRENGMRRWRLLCDCGVERIALQKSFSSGGRMRSCGCASPKQSPHGKSKSPEYRHWINMISRCENPNTPNFEDYGGRGIAVCARWRSEFLNFYADMGPRPASGYSVDRIDVNGDYEPDNCKWATRQEQSRNTRTNRIVNIDGSRMTLAEAVEAAPVPYNTVLYRIKRGWTLDDALRLPAKKGYRPHAS